MRTFVSHDVMFLLDKPGDVLRTADGAYARLTGVTVHLPPNGLPTVWAGGMRCRKDGEPDRRMGRVSVSVLVPDSEVWIERAQAAMQGSSP